MEIKIAEEVKPQAALLVVATVISVGIWVVSWFIPAAAWIVYPLQLFATYIHEGSHVLAAVLTGNTVTSLTVSPDTSGVVYSYAHGFSGLLVSSAGYLGTTAFGTLLLVWMRYGFSSRAGLYTASAFVGVMTVVFGLITPFWNLLANVTFLSVVFTVFAGIILSALLSAIARFATLKWVNFALAFLAVQCLLNALFALKELFFITTSTDARSDAANMAATTGIPGLVWVVLWAVISVVMIAVGLRLYSVTKNRSSDSLFND